MSSSYPDGGADWDKEHRRRKRHYALRNFLFPFSMGEVLLLLAFDIVLIGGCMYALRDFWMPLFTR